MEAIKVQSKKPITKKAALTRTNSRTVGLVAVASFIVVFCLVASNSLFSQWKYQTKVAGAKEKANKQLEANIAAYGTLQSAYKKFNESNPNAIGGNTAGVGDNDGNNAKIVLDSLPSVYDFPALTSSIEKILKDRNIQFTSISGTDDQATQATASSGSPAPIAMPFGFTVTANYGTVQSLLDTLQKSIRPMQTDTLNVSGSSANLTMTYTGHTYFQPAKDFNITSQEIR